jgi:NDP-sugar pyrophosphorylase family protein
MRLPSTAVILSGGEGIRLRPLTNDIPKGLVPVAGKPLLQWVVEWLRENRVSDLVIGVAYLKEKVMKHFGDGAKFGVNITYSIHTVEGGTGEAFRLAISRYVKDDTFFALNGDQITDLRLGVMAKAHSGNGTVATIATAHPRLPFGLVSADEDGYCTGFMEKPLMRDLYCSSGIYVFQRAILDYLPEKGDLEKTAFPQLVRERRLRAYRHVGRFLTVNSMWELEDANRELKRSKQ